MCMYMHVCVYICIYVCIHIHTYMCIHVYVCVCISVYVYVYAFCICACFSIILWNIGGDIRAKISSVHVYCVTAYIYSFSKFNFSAALDIILKTNF